jgi:hypothetical protein
VLRRSALGAGVERQGCVCVFRPLEALVGFVASVRNRPSGDDSVDSVEQMWSEPIGVGRTVHTRSIEEQRRVGAVAGQRDLAEGLGVGVASYETVSTPANPAWA